MLFRSPVGGICTLAHCKFSQSGRRNLVEMAEIGDWIVGTGGKSAYSAGHGRLIYAMRVTDKIPLRTYLTVRQYGPLKTVQDMTTIFGLLAGHIERIAEERVIPHVVMPLRDRIMSRPG